MSSKKCVFLLAILGLLAATWAIDEPSAETPERGLPFSEPTSYTPRGEHPNGERPNYEPRSESPHGEHSAGEQPNSEPRTPRGEHPDGERPNGERFPHGEHPDGEHSDGEHHDGEGRGPSSEASDNSTEVERRYDFSFDAKAIEAQIRVRQGDIESEVRHAVTASSFGVEFRVKFEQRAGDTENQLRMRLRLFELIEYIPDKTPGYQNETIVRTYKSWNWGVGFFDATPDQLNDSRVFALKTADNFFGITIRINRPVGGNVTVNPEDVKFDIHLDAEAMRAAGWLNGTEVALKAALASRLEADQNHDGEEHSIALGTNTTSEFGALAVTWLNYIECGNNTVDVIPSSLREDRTQSESDDDEHSVAHVMSFSFVGLANETNTQCTWDPTVAAVRADVVATATTSSSDPSTSPTRPAATTPSRKASSAALVVASAAAMAVTVAALF